MATCNLKDLSPGFHDVCSQIPEDCRQARGKKRTRWLMVCSCLNMPEEIFVPLYEPLNAKGITSIDIEEYPTIMQMPVAVYKRDAGYSRQQIWSYRYVGDSNR